MSNLLQIKLYGCDVLKKIAEPVTELTPELRSIIEVMLDTMYENDGIGIAAPQIGLSKRIIIIDYDFSKTGVKNPTILINPELIGFDGERTSEEGCLSLPNIYAEVVRYKYIKMKYLDIEMNEKTIDVEDIFATILQHEYDHLNGVLFVEKIGALKKMTIGLKLNRLYEKGSKMLSDPVYIDSASK